MPRGGSTRCEITRRGASGRGYLGGPQPDREPGKFRKLREARVLVWGDASTRHALNKERFGADAEARVGGECRVEVVGG